MHDLTWFSAAILLSLSATALVVTEEAKLESNDGVTGDVFGFSVSLSGDTALVGAPGSQAGSGAAYVLERRAGQWIQQKKLKAPGAAARDGFGFSVSLSGDTALVGVPRDDDNAKDSGAAYVFERNGTDWSQRAKLNASDAAVGDEFGRSVALVGDTAVIGAALHDPGGIQDAGAAYVFARSGTTWSERAKLVASDGAAGDHFGHSVTITGELALIGAPLDDDNGPSSGSAYVFTHDGSLWGEEAKLMAGDGMGHDEFGLSVSLNGQTALIGSPRNDESGAAYVFRRRAGQWSEEAKLKASDGMSQGEFGTSVALEEHTACVGASQTSNANGALAGTAYVFANNGTLWTERAKLTASDGESLDAFARSVSMSGDVALAGAPGGNGHNTDSGVAYVFVLAFVPEPIGYCTAKSGLMCGTPVISFTGSPSASIANGFVIRAEPARKGKLGLFLYTNQGRANVPFQGGKLCLAGQIRSSPVVSSGGGGNCAGAFSIDWNAFAQGLLGGAPHPFLRGPGQQIDVQVWGRDSPGTGSFLSNALEYVVCN